MFDDPIRSMFVALDPPPALAKMIADHKRQVRRLVGEKLYLDHPPHLTLYYASFSRLDQVVQALAPLAKNWPAPRTTLAGWRLFSGDPRTGAQTLVYDVSPESAKPLRAMQEQTIEALAPLRNRETTERRLQSGVSLFTEPQLRSAQRCGYPFAGDLWIPHFTIASLDAADWPLIEENLLADAPSGEFRMGAAKIYWLVDGEPCVVESFPLS